MSRLQAFSKDFLVPLTVGSLPFLPNIYSALTEPKLHFVYEVVNKEDPVAEWNRQLEAMFKRLEPGEDKSSVALSAPVLRKIGAEVYKNLPAMLAGAGVMPDESSTVAILNTSDGPLTNIRVHFVGCIGFESYRSWPDSVGSPNNPSHKEPATSNEITLRYDRLPPSVSRTTASEAQLTFFGAKTSDCHPTVEAEASGGKTAIGKQAVIQTYLNETAWDKYESEQRRDAFVKLLLSSGLLYVYFQVRSLRRRVAAATAAALAAGVQAAPAPLPVSPPST